MNKKFEISNVEDVAIWTIESMLTMALATLANKTAGCCVCSFTD